MEEGATATDNAPTLCHRMGEETVQVLDRRARLRNVVLLHALLMVDTASGENGASVQLLAEAKRAQEDVTGYATVQSLRMAVKTALDLERTQRRRNANRKPPNVLLTVVTGNGASGANVARLVAEENKRESENVTNRSRQREGKSVVFSDRIRKLRNATRILVDLLGSH